MNKLEKGALSTANKTPIKEEQQKTPEGKKQSSQQSSNNKKISDFFPEKSVKSKSSSTDQKLNEKASFHKEKDFTHKKRLRPGVDTTSESQCHMVIDLEHEPQTGISKNETKEEQLKKTKKRTFLISNKFR